MRWHGVEQRMEINSPLALVILMLGANDFQSVHQNNAWHSGQGLAAVIRAMRRAPIEPGMPVPPILVVAPPPITTPVGKPIWEKFEGAPARSERGRRSCTRRSAAELECQFFDAGTSRRPTSPHDGMSSRCRSALRRLGRLRSRNRVADLARGVIEISS